MTELYNHISTVSSDVDVTLNIACQVEVIEESYKDQEIHYAADGSTSRKGFSEDSIGIFKIQYRVLTASDAGTIFDIYHDTDKANGLTNSFKFVHPDGYTYVVKFAKEIPRDINPASYSFESIDLIAIGRILSSDFLEIGGETLTIGGESITL